MSSPVCLKHWNTCAEVPTADDRIRSALCLDLAVWEESYFSRGCKLLHDGYFFGINSAHTSHTWTRCSRKDTVFVFFCLEEKENHEDKGNEIVQLRLLWEWNLFFRLTLSEIYLERKANDVNKAFSVRGSKLTFQGWGPIMSVTLQECHPTIPLEIATLCMSRTIQCSAQC